jgi:hypothetical protein
MTGIVCRKVSRGFGQANGSASIDAHNQFILGMRRDNGCEFLRIRTSAIDLNGIDHQSSVSFIENTKFNIFDPTATQ